MLTEQDKQTGHALAGSWLERVREPDPLILAMHFEKGGETARAAYWFVEVAERALRSDDPTAAISAIERSLALQPEGDSAAKCWALKVNAAVWAGNFTLAISAFDEAQQKTRPGSYTHSIALWGAVAAALALRQKDRLMTLVGLLGTVEPEDEAITPFMSGLAMVIVALTLAGQRGVVAFFLSRMRTLAARCDQTEVISVAWLHYAEAFWQRFMERNPYAALQFDRSAEQHFESAGDYRYATLGATSLALDLAVLGAFEEAEHHYVRVARRLSARANSRRHW